MGNSLAARAWYPPCHPFVFLFWGCPGPQSWDDPSLPLCWEHEGEGGGGSLGPVNSQLAIPLLFSLTVSRSRIMARWHAELLPGSCLLNCLRGRFIRGLQRDPTLLLDELIDLKEPHIYLQQLYFRRSGLTLIVSRLWFWTLVMGSWPWCHPALLSEAPKGPGLRVGSSAPPLNCSVWPIILVKNPVALIAFVFVPNNVWYESIAEKILGSGRTTWENVKNWSIFY